MGETLGDAMTEITPELLLHAYASGVFPMAESRDDPELHWIDPRQRGILPLDGFHISHSLAKLLRRNPWRVVVNEDFHATVMGCAARAETWINPQIFELYQQLHSMGFAHSLEVRDGDTLIGGLYGVALGGAFFGESMFSAQRDASKYALAHLVHRLRAGGFSLCDTQFLTPHLASLGGIEIPRSAYRRQLQAALRLDASFTPKGYCASPGSVASPSSAPSDSSSSGMSLTSGGT